MELIFYLLLNYIYVVTIILFVTKIAFFVHHKNKNWKLDQFLYFNVIDIKLSKPEGAKHKKLQNILTVTILFFFIVNIILVALFGN